MEASSNSSAVLDGGDGGRSALPHPMPAANGPPPFLVKTYDMVDDPSTDKIVSWSSTNNSFVVWDSAEFARDLLPKYFKHSNFSSFVRQLNTYGFRKVDPDRWEFANEGFLRGQKYLLKSISRRKPAHGHPPLQQHVNAQSSVACVEVGKFGLEEEVERLKRDKNVLMQELVRVRQQQQSTDGQLQTTIQRLQVMEQRQQQMMSFLAKAVNSPGFLAQFMQQPNDGNRRLTEGNKKRRLKQEGTSDDYSVGRPADGQIVKYQPLINEAAQSFLKEIRKLDPSRLENIGNNSSGFLIGNIPSVSNQLDPRSSPDSISGVTLQEVPPASGPAFIPLATTMEGAAELAANQFENGVPLDVTQEALLMPTADSIQPEIPVMVPEVSEGSIKTEANGYIDPAFPVTADIPPIEMDDFSPSVSLDWDNSLLEDISQLPGISSPFWEKYLQSPPLGAEVDSTLTTEYPQRGQEEDGWDKSQNMADLTEQMENLSSEPRNA